MSSNTSANIFANISGSTPEALELLKKTIFDRCWLQGDFLLRSGQRSERYFDKYRLESDPQLLKAIAKHMAPLIPSTTQVLAGLELGGVPLATALSLETGLPVVFVRKKAKDYGTCQIAEGVEIAGKELCVIEDVVTTGGQLVLSTKDLRAHGAQIEHAVCVLYRGQSPSPELEPQTRSIHLNLQALFTV